MGLSNIKANDYLLEYYGTGNWYQTLVPGFHYTDGVKGLCGEFQCYWLLDIIVSYQPEIRRGDYGDINFQEWVLEKYSDDTAVVKCFTEHNRGGGCIIQQEIPYTDFPGESTKHKQVTEAIIWVANDVAYLPSEE